MRILMLTNTFAPHVGGVARSVQRFADEYKRLGHKVVIVAPGVDGEFQPERGVIRIPALGNVNGSSFALPLIHSQVRTRLKVASAMFSPDVIHTHHPFLLGDVARLVSDSFKVPLVFTHHTMYESYSYALGDTLGNLAPPLISALATKFANCCDKVIAPSASTREILRQRGVHASVEVVPTGVDVDAFAQGDGRRWRKTLGIPETAPVIGYVGRLAPEKNLAVLLAAVHRVLARVPTAHFILVGRGPAESALRPFFVDKRMHAIGSHSGQSLVDAYHSMDVFGFSSLSETQGMVLVEAMAAGVPVVALDASGVRDVVVDGVNGLLVRRPDDLDRALEHGLSLQRAGRFTPRATAEAYSMRACAMRAIDVYRTSTYANKTLLQIRGLVGL